MKISQILTEEFIKLDLENNEKEGIIEELVDMIYDQDKLKQKDVFLKAVIEREKLGTTGIGKCIAIPHGKNKSVKEMTIVFGRSVNGVDFEALDDKPVNLIFLLAAPINIGGVYLKTLAGLSRILRNDEYREELLKAKTKKEIIDFIKKVE